MTSKFEPQGASSSKHFSQTKFVLQAIAFLHQIRLTYKKKTETEIALTRSARIAVRRIQYTQGINLYGTLSAHSSHFLPNSLLSTSSSFDIRANNPNMMVITSEIWIRAAPRPI